MTMKIERKSKRNLEGRINSPIALTIIAGGFRYYLKITNQTIEVYAYLKNVLVKNKKSC